ncbi:GntR family transcriptional regulator [Sphaerisporangium krabiense]|uniref:DNA-binding GntR family transcriptional regulator n=1 Tax=Sphaerisporangium krabiense TaxID=763782 RepID=A0A7W8ZCJ9_9ACTN|nr:FCD domain-containing protein [Sphaerisporangium krabiense]MBB5631542.1 DNA-binding GntR family transcriptional regulator [Sphaerisporangium krabiense]GII60956.1 GntR family transcriptional regulator [Sphaerisporangium krabiense]
MPQQQNGPKKTRTDRVYEQIRADIFAARLKPGARLKFPDLCAAYDTSVGVAREALARLAAERLVRPQPHQGYTVAELSQDQLTDLTMARVEIEAMTFRQAVVHGDMAWEGEIVAAHHVLSRIDPREFAEATADVLEEWYAAHEVFHRALLRACPSRRMVDIALALRDEAELYRRWAGPLGNEKDRDVAGEHRAILEAALARDADLAARLLRDHIAHTTQVLISGVESVDALTPE